MAHQSIQEVAVGYVSAQRHPCKKICITIKVSTSNVQQKNLKRKSTIHGHWFCRNCFYKYKDCV